MRRALHKKMVRVLLCMMLMLSASQGSFAQADMAKYFIQDGRMFVVLDKRIREGMLDSFVRQFDLGDLYLKQFIQANLRDSLLRRGWKIEADTRHGLMISKPFDAIGDIIGKPDKMILTDKNENGIFPAVNNGISFGYNRFTNKFPFLIQDSLVTFFLKNHIKAGQVMLSGSFNNWSPGALAMKRTDSGWIAQLKLGPGKYWYKFIEDGNWITDPDNNLRENDGKGNTNSVYFRTNHVFRLEGFAGAKNVFLAGSFNGWNGKQLAMKRTGNGWELPAYLAEGTHTYKFVVDGKWYADPANADRLPDGNGGFNSVLRLGRTYTFHLNGFTDARKVVVSGSFNNWKEDELLMNRTASGWELPYTIGPGNYEYKFIVDGRWMSDRDNPLTADRGEGNSYLVIEPNYTFRLRGFADAKKVYLSGDFNNWSPEAFPMRREGDSWVFPLHLPDGKHRYKFVVDGQWIIDPANKLWEQNEFGTGNSVIWTGQ